MNIKKQETKSMRSHTQTVGENERFTDFTYGLLNSVTEKEINFMEEPGGTILSRDE